MLLLLGLVLFANIRALPEHGQHFRFGNMKRFFTETPPLVECLKAPQHDERLFESAPYVVIPLERNCSILRRIRAGSWRGLAG